jgi:hypothetical protein
VTSYSYDIIDGREVPPLVITSDYVLEGYHRGSVRVEAGIFELRGRIEGSLGVHRGATATISGTQAGSVHVADGVEVAITGAVEGSAHVSPGGVVVVEPGGKLAGSLHNDGRVVVRGVFGGSRSGSGELAFEDDGYEKRPKMIRDGVHYYEW